MAKKKWADVKDTILKKEPKDDEEDETVKVSAKGKSKKATPRPRVRKEREGQIDRVPAAVRNARPALGRQSNAKAWTYSD
jgi:hypothetical protein